MHEHDDINLDETLLEEGALDLDLPRRRVPVLPLRMRTSGTYTGGRRIRLRHPINAPAIPGTMEIDELNDLDDDMETEAIDTMDDTMGATDADEISDENAIFPWFTREVVRLDVDGSYAQNVISGEIISGLAHRLHWIANLRRRSRSTWTGTIIYRNGVNSLLPHTRVMVRASRSFIPQRRRLRVTFYGGGQMRRVRDFRFKSSYFHDVEFEFDREQGVTHQLSINTHSHPNHPATLPSQNLSIDAVYRRAGFRVTNRVAPPVVPSALSLGNGDPRWDDNEMHDAMTMYWSKFANRPQWAMWVFSAKQHIRGPGLGGIMFDDIGANHRQGAAIFYDSFISDTPTNDPAPNAYVDRMQFWTMCHEMGHGFNLAHSWQKNHAFGSSWIPLVNDPAALSFMNYPFSYPDGENKFFERFEYRFTNQELLFLRHAPGRFVQPGNAAWFQNHGFENANTEEVPRFQLDLRLNRDTNVCGFLEPVRAELKLLNVSNRPQMIDNNTLRNTEHLTICTMREGGQAKQVLPAAQYCNQSEPTLLQPGKALFATVDVSFGRDGWTITDQGRYVVQACLDLEGVDVVSNPMQITVLPPENREEMVLAQDVFTADTARVLTFRGSQYLESSMNTLRQVADQLRGNPLAMHANLCLGRTMMRNYKILDLKDATHTEMSSVTNKAVGKSTVKVYGADIEAARTHIDAALNEHPELAAETFANVGYHDEVDNISTWLAESGDEKGALAMQDKMARALKRRIVTKDVEDDVMTMINDMKETLRGGKKVRAAKN